MSITISPDLEIRLGALATERSLSVEELVDSVLKNYVESAESSDRDWVTATRHQLPKVWPEETFDDWQPPRDR